MGVKFVLNDSSKGFIYPGMMTTHAESINSDLQRGPLDRRLRHNIFFMHFVLSRDDDNPRGVN